MYVQLHFVTASNFKVACKAKKSATTVPMLSFGCAPLSNASPLAFLSLHAHLITRRNKFPPWSYGLDRFLSDSSLLHKVLEVTCSNVCHMPTFHFARKSVT
jgi:hypothetical protein